MNGDMKIPSYKTKYILPKNRVTTRRVKILLSRPYNFTKIIRIFMKFTQRSRCRALQKPPVQHSLSK